MILEEHEAFDRLIEYARGDHEYSSEIAAYLLMWWDRGRFPFSSRDEIWVVFLKVTGAVYQHGGSVYVDMVKVLTVIESGSTHSERIGYAADFAAILERWHPGSM